MTSHEPTNAYVERRPTEGLSKAEIMRCLKRYVARELFPLIRGISDQRILEEGVAPVEEIAAPDGPSRTSSTPSQSASSCTR